MVVPRETRERWPLLTVETEVNGDSKSTNERCPSLVGHCPCFSVTRDFFSALAALVVSVQNIVFLTVHYFNSFVPIAQQSGQAVVLGCLSLSICLWLCLPEGFHQCIKQQFFCCRNPLPTPLQVSTWYLQACQFSKNCGHNGITEYVMVM